MIGDKENFRLTKISRKIRRDVLSMIVSAHASHIGSSYSIVELLIYLYEKIIRIDPKKPFASDRDRFILSKGWGVSALYSVLAHKKIIDEKSLSSYCKDGSLYIGISSRNGIAGIEATTGSMGHGLPIAVGIALAAQMRGEKYRSIVLMGDGELDEGSTWEAMLLASQYHLENLLVLIDCNGWQSYGRTQEVLATEPIEDKFISFGWRVKHADGHNFFSIDKALRKIPFARGKPSVVLAKTIKGKGVSVFEDNNEWHYKTPSEKEILIAKHELKE